MADTTKPTTNPETLALHAGYRSDPHTGSVAVPLATGQMAFANGAVIPVDGGLSILRL